jgi:hypothetical protein
MERDHEDGRPSRDSTVAGKFIRADQQSKYSYLRRPLERKKLEVVALNEMYDLLRQ